MSHLLATDNLVCGYDTPILGPLNLEFPAGAFVLLEGPNGIGKSTLLRTLVGLQPPLSGEVNWSVDIESRRYVPQVRTLDPVLPATVADVIETGALRGSGLQSLWSGIDDEHIDELLQHVQMAEFRDHLFRELSEGQKQLVLLARALVGDAEVMLLDEPTASMDPDRQDRALDLLQRQRDTHDLSIFLVAHGNQEARRAADLILKIDKSRQVTIQSA